MNKGNDELLWPTCLFGDAIGVKIGWMQLFQKALQLGDWGPLLGEGSSRAIEEVPGLIIIDDQLGLTERRSAHWRLNWITHSFLFADCEGRYPLEPFSPPHHQLFLRGLRYSWFALATLANLSGLAPATVLVSQDEATASVVIGSYVRWESLFQKLHPRFVGGARSQCVPYEQETNPDLWWLPWNPFLELLHQRGLGPDKSIREAQPRNRKDRDVPGWLCDQGVISRVGDEYELRVDHGGMGQVASTESRGTGTVPELLPLPHCTPPEPCSEDLVSQSLALLRTSRIAVDHCVSGWDPIRFFALRTGDVQNVIRLMTTTLASHDAMISPPHQGWVLIFDADLDHRCTSNFQFQFNSAPLAVFAELAGVLCRGCECPALAFDTCSWSDCTSWWLFSASGYLRAQLDPAHPHDLDRTLVGLLLCQLLIDNFDIAPSSQLSVLTQEITQQSIGPDFGNPSISSFLQLLGISFHRVSYSALFRSLGRSGETGSSPAITFVQSPSDQTAGFAAHESRQ
jgi:hypothetical protein